MDTIPALPDEIIYHIMSYRTRMQLIWREPFLIGIELMRNFDFKTVGEDFIGDFVGIYLSSKTFRDRIDPLLPPGLQYHHEYVGDPARTARNWYSRVVNACNFIIKWHRKLYYEIKDLSLDLARLSAIREKIQAYEAELEEKYGN